MSSETEMGTEWRVIWTKEPHTIIEDFATEDEARSYFENTLDVVAGWVGRLEYRTFTKTTTNWMGMR